MHIPQKLPAALEHVVKSKADVLYDFAISQTEQVQVISLIEWISAEIPAKYRPLLVKNYPAKRPRVALICAPVNDRSEERRLGKERVRTGRFRWSPSRKKTIKKS